MSQIKSNKPTYALPPRKYALAAPMKRKCWRCGRRFCNDYAVQPHNLTKNRIMKSFVKRACLFLLAAFAGGNFALAQTNTPATTNKPAATAPRLSKRFTGKIAKVDAQAKSFTLESTASDPAASAPTLVNSQTIITKDKKPATFDDLAVGQAVTGAKHQDPEGKWVAATVNVAVPKPPTVDPKLK